MRVLILETDAKMTEEWKWMGTPVWSHHGIVCTRESYTKAVKLTFAQGAEELLGALLLYQHYEGAASWDISAYKAANTSLGAY